MNKEQERIELQKIDAENDMDKRIGLIGKFLIRKHIKALKALAMGCFETNRRKRQT